MQDLEENYDFGDYEGFDDLDDSLFDGEVETDFETRVMQPKKVKTFKQYNVRFSNAQALANHVNMQDDERRYFCVVNGRFIFGDFIEALLVRYRWHVKKLTISTLSMNQNNVDSLRNLVMADYIDEVNLIVSATFYANHKNSLVRYIYDKLDIENKFQFAVVRSHCKIVLIETHCGKKIVIHGSANLPSCDCLEQFVIEQCDDLYDFSLDYQERLINLFSTINKEVKNHKITNQAIGGADIWQKIGLQTGHNKKKSKVIIN